jgi:hypothetical protein
MASAGSTRFVQPRIIPENFRLGREDYHFRYNTGLQLHLVGDSLMGWMVWDLRRAWICCWHAPAWILSELS